MESFAFCLFALSALCAAVITVRSANIVRSVIGLFLCLVFVAGLYFLMGAPFIGAMQLMIYAGGIVVLMIFAVMLVRRITGEPIEHLTRQPAPALVPALVLTAWMTYIVWVTFGPRAHMGPDLAETPRSASIEDIADALIYKYLIPFELASVLLLVAMIGAIALTLRAKQREGPPPEDE